MFLRPKYITHSFSKSLSIIIFSKPFLTLMQEGLEDKWEKIQALSENIEKLFKNLPFLIYMLQAALGDAKEIYEKSTMTFSNMPRKRFWPTVQSLS